MNKRFFGAKQVAMVGLDIGITGTCAHYHSDVDIAGLRCAQCEKYFACYQCHDALEDHHFVPMTKNSAEPVVLCGRCGQELTYQEYKTGACLNCLDPLTHAAKSTKTGISAEWVLFHLLFCGLDSHSACPYNNFLDQKIKKR